MIKLSSKISNGLTMFVLGIATLAFLNVPTFGEGIYSLKYRLKDRRGPTGEVDRREGIESVKIAGEKLYLFSVLFNTKANQSEESSELYRLGFFLPRDESRVNIQIRDYNSFKGDAHYWMFPKQKRYQNGFHMFLWSAQISKELGIHLNHLGARADIRGHDHLIVAPLILQATPLPPRIVIQGCRFIFLPNETMDVEYTLFTKDNEHDPVMANVIEKWHKDQKSIIDWRGRNSASQLSEDGWYILRINAYTTPLGKPTERIPYDYEFYYKSEINVK